MKNKINKNTLIIILVLAVVVLMIGALRVKQILTKPTAVVDENFLSAVEDRVETNYQTPNYIGESVNIPDSLPILETGRPNVESLRQHLNSYCRITEHDEDSHSGEVCNYYTYSSDTIIVSMTEQEYGAAIMDLERAQSVADEFIEEFYPADSSPLVSGGYFTENSDLNAFIDDYDEYYLVENPVEGELIPQIDFGDSGYHADPEESTAITFYYMSGYDGIPVSRRDQADNNISVTVNSYYQVVSAFLDTRSAEVTPTREQYRTLGIDEALANIGNNYAYTDYITSEEDIYNLSNIELDATILEYRLNDNRSQAIPVYNFYGTATNASGENVELAIITPAIEFSVAPAAQ